MHITLIAGARPNFMKIAPIIRAMDAAIAKGEGMEYSLIHTGQHYDKAMSGNFFEQLGIPEPSANLECGGGSQAEQTAAIMVAFERYLMQHPTDWVVVVGDVTSTMACSIVAKKLGVKVAHVEGGIRSWDMGMPEEINQLVTDFDGKGEDTTELWEPSNSMLNNMIWFEIIDTINYKFINTLFKVLKLAFHRIIDLNLKRSAILVNWQGITFKQFLELFNSIYFFNNFKSI